MGCQRSCVALGGRRRPLHAFSRADAPSGGLVRLWSRCLRFVGLTLYFLLFLQLSGFVVSRMPFSLRNRVHFKCTIAGLLRAVLPLDNDVLLTGCADKVIRRFDGSGTSCVQEYKAHTDVSVFDSPPKNVFNSFCILLSFCGVLNIE